MGLCDAASASAAALVDSEGETVDYAGALDPFEIRVAAAEWRLILRTIQESTVPSCSTIHQFLYRGRCRSFAVLPLQEGYAIVVELAPHSFALSHRAALTAIRELCAEAGLPLPPAYTHETEHWLRVEIQSERTSRRPVALWQDGRWCPLLVLGRLAEHQLERGVLGFRVRMENGREATVVRERLDHWYIDDVLAST